MDIPIISIRVLWAGLITLVLAGVMGGWETTAASSTNISHSEYLEGVAWREAGLREAEATVDAAKEALTETETSLAVNQADLDAAMESFTAAELTGDRDALDAAWLAVRYSLDQWTVLNANHGDRLAEYNEAVDLWQKRSIWLAQFENDFEAQTNPFAVRDAIALCGTGYCSPSYFLEHERFTVFQPHVLEMVGAHHAYAKGLTGKGVRIAIEDDAVNFTLPEFAGRISFDGANLAYPVYDGDEFPSDAWYCELTGQQCQLWTYSSDYADLMTLTVRWAIAQYGWPAAEEQWFIRNDYHEQGSLESILGLRWREIPHATGSDSHGTRVASVAAGRDFGVAPGATIVPIFKDFDPRRQSDQRELESTLLRIIKDLPEHERRVVDTLYARDVESSYMRYDVINRSFGIGVFDPAAISAVLEDETQWWGEGFRQILPETWRAFMQTRTHPDDRTVVVYAAGNDTEKFGALGADLPYYERHVRGHHLSVMAVDHDGRHASYSNFCGPLPYDWDTDRWGRHFCLAAPGTVNAAAGAGPGYIFHETEGTSFAAPVVTGAVALLMEHFRGQLGNTEIVKRVVNTANNEGRYAQIEIYGAGLLDLKAALQPVGGLYTGTPSLDAATTSTVAEVPRAMGSFARRLSAQGVEVASLDSMGAPFWASPEQFVHTIHERSAIPAFAEPEWTPHLGFTPGVVAGPGGHGLRMLAGDNRIGVERAPREGFRWGMFGDAASWMDGRPSGAFGDRVRFMTGWIGRSARIELDGNWRLDAQATVGLGRVFYRSGAMLDIDTHLLSAWDVGVERGQRGSGTWSRLSLSQPLRAESGKGTLTYLSGLEDGAPVYASATVPLAPRGRELELTLTHEVPIGSGRWVVEMAHSWNAAHEPGQTQARVGAAYRVSW